MTPPVVKVVTFRDKALAAAPNVADEGALSFMDLRVRLQVLAFGKSLPAPWKFAAEGLGTVVEVHVVDETYFSLKNLSTSHLRTLITLLSFDFELFRVLFLLEKECLRV